MTKKIYTFLLAIICSVSAFSLVVSAENPEVYQTAEELMCISYRGDTALYEANSAEAVLSAFSKGADFVSVSVRKPPSGDFVLCSENAAEITGVLLKDMLSLLEENQVLILDFDNEHKDEIYNLLKDESSLDKAWLRIKDSADEINKWTSDKEDVKVIGVTSSFNIFTIRSFVKKLAYLPAVQLQSKNYFNVMYDSWCYSLYDTDEGTRAVAPMYEPDLCGQRSDSEDGWNDLIKKNFSIIETNNIDSFMSYKELNIKLKENLITLLQKAKAIDIEAYSLVSKENLADSIETGESLIKDGLVSNDELQSAASLLQRAINNMTLSDGTDTQKGALNITAGKVVATVIVGIAIFAAQIYTYKMQKKKKN